MKVFLDLDGVIVDFMGGLEREFNITIPVSSIYVGWREIVKLTHLSNTAFWKRIDLDFWKNLEKTVFADQLLALVDQFNPTILTKPTIDGASGKQAWIKKNMNDYFSAGKYLIGPDKAAVAGPDRLLIDDNEDNVSDWLSEGGDAILVPAPWNILHGTNPIVYIYKQLTSIFGDEY